MPPRWREQYDRMRRWQDRLWLDPVLHGEHAVDSFYAFAQACYHLVDWLEKDPSACAHVKASPVLSFCREICNGSKHARLAAKKVLVTSKKTAESYHIEDDSGQPVEHVTESTELFVDWEGKPTDIESFAKLCVDDWDRFLRSEGLL